MAGNALSDIKLLIFDIDGTLVDAYEAIERSFNFTMEQIHEPKKSKKIIRKAVGWGDRNLLAPFVKKTELDRALGIYRKHHQSSLVRYSRLYGGVKALLKELCGSFKTAVASNRPTKFSELLLEHLKIKEYFDFILCSDSIDRGKPDPLILKKILVHFNLLRHQALYIGDMAIDAQTAMRAGVRAVIVTTGSNTRREIEKERPFRIIGDIRELREIL